jgi:hypothetical protein
MHRQPTPESIATAEIRLGEITPRTVEDVKAAMARARDAERDSDQNACGRALAEVRRLIGP